MKENSCIISSSHQSHHPSTSSSSAPPKNGLAISSVPSSGDTKLTCVPRITTSPNRRVWLVTCSGSSGSGVIVRRHHIFVSISIQFCRVSVYFHQLVFVMSCFLIQITPAMNRYFICINNSVKGYVRKIRITTRL